METEIRHKDLLQVSVCGLNIDMRGKNATRFSMEYEEKRTHLY